MAQEYPTTQVGQIVHAMAVAGIVGLSPFSMIFNLFIGYCHQSFKIQIISLGTWVLLFWLTEVVAMGTILYQKCYAPSKTVDA